MPRRKFDKKTATTFNLVHRAQNDPLIDDNDAPSMVFAEKPIPVKNRRPTDDDYAYSSAASVISGSSYRSSKTRHRGDLEDEFRGADVRENEGEAAQHGIFFDDTQYDYMKHMRDLGSGSGATWVEARSADDAKKRSKQSLADALRGMDLDETRSVGMTSMTSSSSIARSLLPEEVLPSEFVRRKTYQDQQDVPDEIAGFQPDMDMRLREVLEALEDEAYVDELEEGEEGNIFAELTQDGYEVDRDEWERLGEQQLFDDEYYDEDDAGWESDDTIKAANSPKSKSRMPEPPSSEGVVLPEGETAEAPSDVQAQPPADPTAGAWLDEYKKFKSSQNEPALSDIAEGGEQKPRRRQQRAPSAFDASLISSLASGRRKKRKGAQTSTTNYSMTSSSLVRTSQHSLLDERFDKIEEAYTLAEFPEDEEFNENASLASGLTGVSPPNSVRGDFDGILDDFLGSYNKAGKVGGGRIRKGAPLTGMQQLDEVRNGLGAARITASTARAAAGRP
ncbi:Low temperature viability protein [Dissoconium aciculare CBS 342.82]|uniref:Low temperature viability protein n=1 Tax=Dissoconium aciculare CBS 342.82 TaxID=1314786 RepID=A0A6J3M4U9_9PEZI|nr:Low temperature viability protein [Dissoconium aciculare CBS 342.82]KAF1823056.1 Low temperature viability protein [Dissoconium aciculare CBS 342.82]